MQTFILTIDWTDKGINAIKDAPERGKASRALAKKLGVEVKEAYSTSGEHDLLVIVEAPHVENVTKFAFAISSLGNMRTRTSIAWTEAEWTKLVSELP
jgi:uncharacterized protein with GYD domain